MTEVMVHSSVGKTFSDSKFKVIQPESRSQLLSDKSTVILKEKTDVESDKSSENTICGSNSNNSVQINDVPDASTRTRENNVLIKYVATETTVINTTCDVISRSTVLGKKNTTTLLHYSNSASEMTDDTDKSRVVVQMLSSDIKKSVKSHNIIENKSTNPESQSTTHSFREDVFKMLSKPQPSKLNIVNNNNKEKVSPCAKAQVRRKVCTSQMLISENKQISDVALKVSNKSQVIPSLINGSFKTERNRRKRGFRSYALFGKSTKIGDIKPVPSYLQMTKPNVLRMFHYVLYDRYGLCSNRLEVLETKRRILNFCGYPFKKSSEEYIKRTNLLHKMPRAMLFEIHQAIFGKTCLKNRNLMIQHLMEFFLDPKRYKKIAMKINQHVQHLLSKECKKEYQRLKEIAAQGPLPSVLLQRLTMMDVERIKNEIKLKSIQLKAQEQHKDEVIQKDENVIQKNDGSESIYSLPAYILKGPGKKLKFFSSIVRNIKRASKKDVSLLHYILYGRTETESVEVCRRNILEFSGFIECQTQFIAERKTTLLRLDQRDLFELCKILSLQVSTNSRFYRIKKIMDYLMSPFNPLKIKSKIGKDTHTQLELQRRSSLSGSKHFTFKPNESRGIKHAKISVSKRSKEIESIEGCRLRDIKAICVNIECSAPSNLTELNDLLFVKPCDETEIHEKILNFTRFLFSDNSTQYYYRKNLLFYMGPCLVRKIAKLLDLENCDVEPSIENLSSNILKFLMKKKGIDSPAEKPSLSTLSSFNSTFNEKPKAQDKVLQPVTLENEKKKAIACDKKRVFIHRISKDQNNESTSSDKSLITSSYMDERNEIEPSADHSKDDSIPLRVFIHHPTDQELKYVIHGVIKDDLWHFTLGELVQKVYEQYPQFNLQYRENFIKTEARQILSELRSNAFDVVQYMTLNKLSM